MPKQRKRKLSLTSDTDVDTDRTCEVEVSYEGEADLHEHLNSCEKNPGHKNFVPVDQFSIEHLPSDYRNNDLLDLIRALSDLTVRVSVKYVSDRRPKTWPGSNKPYPFCEDKHSRNQRIGTGWVRQVEKATKQFQCSICNIYPSPRDHHFMFLIETAAHVVYDEQEAQHTTCHLFFDKGGTPGHSAGVVTTKLSFADQDKGREDRCTMYYVTCDSNVTDRLKKNLKLFESLKRKVRGLLFDKIKERSAGFLHSARYGERPLCVIVSHPHGCSKQVSVGYCTSRTPSEETNELTQLTYTTPTCRGSSGAVILLLEDLDCGTGHVHGGKCEGNKELNYSSWGIDEFYHFVSEHVFLTGDSTSGECHLCLGNSGVDRPRLQMLFVGDERQEPWDVEVSYGGETELHQRYHTCEKNQGHQKLIPVDQLNEDHLRYQFKITEWLDLIRVLSDLTVRVSVKSVSEKRPDDLKFLKPFSGDEQPDSCYRDSTRNMMLTGTGCVAKVIKYENSDEYRTCSCKECQMSQTPKTEFAHIYIRTAIQVVYDNFEAEHSTCDFFFNRGHTPDTCPGVVTLSGVSVEDCEIKDLKYLICVTHDLCLADRLNVIINKYKNLSKIILEKIKNSSEISFYNNSAEGTAVVVSHPHGCSKQVSVGYVHDDLDTYSTRTCSGSAGAHFLVLEYCSLSSYVHIGKCEGSRYRSHDRLIGQLGSPGTRSKLRQELYWQ